MSQLIRGTINNLKLFIVVLKCRLFLEEISACVAVHTHYVMDACDRVPSIIPLPRMVMPIMLVALKAEC